MSDMEKKDTIDARRVIEEFGRESDISKIAYRLDMPEEKVRSILSNPAVGGEAVRQKALSFGPELVGTLLDRLLVFIQHGDPQHALSAGRLMLQIYKDLGEKDRPVNQEVVEKVITMAQAVEILEAEVIEDE